MRAQHNMSGVVPGSWSDKQPHLPDSGREGQYTPSPCLGHGDPQETASREEPWGWTTELGSKERRYQLLLPLSHTQLPGVLAQGAPTVSAKVQDRELAALGSMHAVGNPTGPLSPL